MRDLLAVVVEDARLPPKAPQILGSFPSNSVRPGFVVDRPRSLKNLENSTATKASNRSLRRAHQCYGRLAETPARLAAVLAVLSLSLVSACSLTPDQITFSESATNASVQEIVVVSGRQPDNPASSAPERDRNGNAAFVRYDVSIPPGHVLGQIEWPSGAANPETDFTVIGTDDLGSMDRLLREIEATPGEEATVFVHGYNSTASEALYRFAQVSHDFEIPQPRVLFAWPSAGTLTGYIYDRDSVLFSRDPLADLLTNISRRTDKRIILLAHSMGAHLTMEVLRQLALTGRRDVLNDLSPVVLLAPDIDSDIFRTQANSIGELPSPFIIMSNRGDRALNFSSYLNFGRQRVGDLSDASDVAGLEVTLFDFTALEDGSNLDHLVPLTSPAAITVLRDLVRSDRRGNPDLSGFAVDEDGVIRALAERTAY